ncbi:MAG TPA: hypothetical protein PK854_06270 [Oscillospiraceae bacterium]|nr:hypothetical protein [Oscillospiraceae bacterium]HPS34851.1 hypothetical protein [Oscillospiraceae bacterium]
MDKLSWSIRVPLLKNNIIRNQLGLALGIPFGILLIILMLVQAWGGLAIVGETLIMGFCFVMFIFRGTYDVQYVLDEKGIICETQNPQKKRVRRMSVATAVMGALTANPTAVAAGISAGAGIKQRFLWKRIRKAKYLDRSATVMIYAGFGETAAVFCTEKLYGSTKIYPKHGFTER